MKYLTEYRNKDIALKLLNRIRKVSKQSVRLMEVCGGHTMAIRRYGIHTLLPENIELLSGPGCPVCVTGTDFIDKAIALSQKQDVIITTYGDLLRVPGSDSDLDKMKAGGADVRVVNSTLEALEIAKDNLLKKIVFLGIGFETTTPSTAIALIKAKKQGLNNFFVLSAHKLMPPAMSALLKDGSNIDGFIGPGHVSTIAGVKMYEFMVAKFGLSIVISGFEPLDILQSILMLVEMIEGKETGIKTQYTRAVKSEGNVKAQEIVNQCFKHNSAYWRGIGDIPDSGLVLNSDYEQFDAEKLITQKINKKPEPKACVCGDILRGIKIPPNCKLFKTLCTPENPVGACMVSDEGTCAAYYRYM